MSRTKINILYYPDMYVSDTTLKKAILLFDELHFIDRPAFTFENFGSIGALSPLRTVEVSFREAGVPLYVHGVNAGKLRGEFLEQTISDINDLEFISRFQSGIKSSVTFKRLQIPKGNYSRGRNADDIAQLLTNVDIGIALQDYNSPNELLFDEKINPFPLSNQLECAKKLISNAALCAAQLNFALSEGVRNDFIPLADAIPYGELLGAKYKRAISKVPLIQNQLQLTDLSFAIFDQIISTDCIEKMRIEDVVAYRKSSQKAREAFLEHLVLLKDKQSKIDMTSNYSEELNKIVRADILPAARAFRNELAKIDDNFHSILIKRTLNTIGVALGTGGAFLNLFPDLSWQSLISFASCGIPYVGKPVVDAVFAKRAAKRECSISYLLSLDKE